VSLACLGQDCRAMLANDSDTPANPPRASLTRWIYPLALAGTVVFASGRGQVAGPEIVNFDKVAHLAVFGLLATLVLRAPGLRHAWVAVVVVSLFGAADELRQSFTPGRFVEFADWVADSAGALIAVAVYRYWPWYRRLLETPLRFPKRAPKSVVSPAIEPAA
jgi:VanZ family protein